MKLEVGNPSLTNCISIRIEVLALPHEKPPLCLVKWAEGADARCYYGLAKIRRTLMPNVAPVLFLDFDGVLHRLGELALDEDFQLLPNPNLFQWRPILERLMEPWPDVRVIVSSDWRRLFDDENLVRLLGPQLGPRFIGVVEVNDESRANELYREVARRGLMQWVALDDHPTVVAASKSERRFVACESNTGLSSLGVQEMLTRQLAGFFKSSV